MFVLTVVPFFGLTETVVIGSDATITDGCNRNVLILTMFANFDTNGVVVTTLDEDLLFDFGIFSFGYKCI